MKIWYFTKDEMVSFGNYLLSEERTKAKMQHPDFNPEQKEESLKQVTHADLSNWFDKNPVELGE